MTLITEHTSSNTEPYLADGFRALDEQYAKHPLNSEDYARFGSYTVTNARIIDTPTEVLNKGEVLTNPSQIEVVHKTIRGVETALPFAYFRREPTTLHLGKTTAVPYLLLRDKRGNPHLSEFEEARSLQGEDPRIMPGVKINGSLGIHTGWSISTIVATPKPDNPADVESIKQVIYWGETLDTLEPIVEIEDLKNTCIFPVSEKSTDTTLDVFGRPHPHITYTRVPDIFCITKELVESGANITDGFLPPDVHTGVNTVKRVAGHPDYRELDIHEAYAPITEAGKILHYRLGRYGIELSTRRLIPLEVTARRSDFPDTAPKPPENGVADYSDILYGSVGRAGSMIVGVSDRHVGIADIVRTTRQ